MMMRVRVRDTTQGEDISRRCIPSEPVGVVHVHGTNDKLIPYGCNAGPAVQNWAVLQGCTAMPVDGRIPVATPSSATAAHRRWGSRLGAARALRYEHCDAGVHVELVTAAGVGHCPDETWIDIEAWLINRPKRTSSTETRRRGYGNATATATAAFSTASIGDADANRRCRVCNGTSGGGDSHALPTSVVGLIAGGGVAILVGFAAGVHLFVERRRRTHTHTARVAVGAVVAREEEEGLRRNRVLASDDC